MYALGAIMAVLYIGGLNKWHDQKLLLKNGMIRRKEKKYE